jgi:hypothetical protein
MFGFMGVANFGTVRMLEEQLQARFAEVAPRLPQETAEKIYTDLNAIAVVRNLAQTMPSWVEQYEKMTNKANETWRSTLSRTWQGAVDELTPWYKKKENLLIIGVAAAALIALIMLTGKKREG